MAYDRCKPCKGASARGWRSRWESGHGPYKGGLNTKMHLAVDANGMPVRFFVTSGTVADCAFGEALIANIQAESLLADKGYDTNAIIKAALEAGMQVVIPPKSNRREQRDYDKFLYKLRHLVENAFLKLKGWRGIATRYAKQTASFAASICVKCIFLWLLVIS